MAASRPTRDVFYVGKTGRVRFRLLAVDPATQHGTPEPNAPSCTIEMRRPNKSLLGARTLADGGVINLGDGYYFADFDFDVAGNHEYRIRASVSNGGEERYRKEVYVHAF